ncbi:hypothetical protein BD769DRAFT_109440 [Suillus cothurnatus]|nr:hypothetical protein BD769DRAFT_109440 [Suillus cothurnatus]
MGRGEDETTRNMVSRYIMMVIWIDPEYDSCCSPAVPTYCDSLRRTALHIGPYNLECLQSPQSMKIKGWYLMGWQICSQRCEGTLGNIERLICLSVSFCPSEGFAFIYCSSNSSFSMI